jgi:hypothetical protein
MLSFQFTSYNLRLLNQTRLYCSYISRLKSSQQNSTVVIKNWLSVIISLFLKWQWIFSFLRRFCISSTRYLPFDLVIWVTRRFLNLFSSTFFVRVRVALLFIFQCVVLLLCIMLNVACGSGLCNSRLSLRFSLAFI